MTVHLPHPPTAERDYFLADGCPRCQEYVADLGLHFSEERFRLFWAKMIAVEFENVDHWRSSLDRTLGRQLYYVALAIQRAFGLPPTAYDALGRLSQLRGVSDY